MSGTEESNNRQDRKTGNNSIKKQKKTKQKTMDTAESTSNQGLHCLPLIQPF